MTEDGYFDVFLSYIQFRSLLYSLRDDTLSKYVFENSSLFKDTRTICGNQYHRCSIYHPSFFLKKPHSKILNLKSFKELENHSRETLLFILFCSKCDPLSTLRFIEKKAFTPPKKFLRDTLLLKRKDIFDVYVKTHPTIFRELIREEEKDFAGKSEKRKYLRFIKNIISGK